MQPLHVMNRLVASSAGGNRCSPTLRRASRLHLVDGELALEATPVALVQRDLHGVVYVADLVAAHLVLDVQAHHWKDTARSPESINKLCKNHIQVKTT